MYCSIAHTTSGKKIFVDTLGWKETNLEDAYAGFSNLELLEALLATQALHFQELRRKHHDESWIKSLEMVGFHIEKKLGTREIERLLESMTIDSAFTRFKFGQSLLHPNFRRNL